jgi:hypothetical protein
MAYTYVGKGREELRWNLKICTKIQHPYPAINKTEFISPRPGSDPRPIYVLWWTYNIGGFLRILLLSLPILEPQTVPHSLINLSPKSLVTGSVVK